MLSREQQNLFYQKLGERIKAARVNSNTKQDALAIHLSLNRVSIVNIEKGKQKVQLHNLIEIAAYLNVRLDDLLPSLDSVKSALLPSKFVKTMEKELEQVEDKDEGKLKLSDFVITYSNSKP